MDYRCVIYESQDGLVTDWLQVSLRWSPESKMGSMWVTGLDIGSEMYHIWITGCVTDRSYMSHM